MYTTFMPDAWGGQTWASESGVGVQWAGTTASVWRSENSLWEFVLSLHHPDTWLDLRVARLSDTLFTSSPANLGVFAVVVLCYSKQVS